MVVRPLKPVARAAAFGIGLLAAGWFVPSAARGANEAAIKRQTAKAVQLYREGKLKEAAKALDRVLAMSPTADLAIELRDQIGFKLLFEMLHNKEYKDLSRDARRLLELAEKGIMAKKADVKTIRARVKELSELDVAKRWSAIFELQAIGDAAVPYLLDVVARPEKIAYNDQSRAFVARGAALIALRRMGRLGSMPLIQALKSKDLNVAQTAAKLLGEADDPRAAAALKAVVDDPQADPLVQKEAEAALQEIMHAPAESLPPAEEMYRLLALDYLRGRFEIVGYIGIARVPFWSFNPKGKTAPQQIVRTMIPAYVYRFKMAQDACYKGLKANPEYERLASMILYQYFDFRQKLGLLIQRKGVSEDGIRALGFSEQDARRRLQALSEIDVLALAPGKSVLYDVIQMANHPEPQPSAPGDEERRLPNPGVALAAIQALQTLGDDRSESAPSPLVECLHHPDASIRYAAANALAVISPSGAMLPSDADRSAVVRALAAALCELGKPAVMVVSQSQPERERFARMLEEIGFTAITVKDGAAAQKLSRMSVPRIAAILIADDLKGFAAPAVAKALKTEVLTRRIPLVLMTTPAKGEKAGAKPPLFAAAVSKEIRTKPLAARLKQTLAKDKATQALVRSARRTVQAALAALSHVHPEATAYPVNDLTPALAPLLQGQPLPIRQGACEMLVRLADPRSIEPLAAVFTDPKANKRLRLTAGAAVGRIILKDSGALTDKMRAGIAAVLNERDRDLRLAAARLLGRGAVDRAAAMAVLNQRRIP